MSSAAHNYHGGLTVTTPADVTQHRDWLLSLVPAPMTGLWVDFGCGTGTDALRLAESQAQPGLRILGIDENRESIEAAQRSAKSDPRLGFRQHSLRAVLPLDDASVDVAFSHNLIECLADVPAFVSELARILRPGGYVVMAHWDWDSQLFDGDDKLRNRRLVHAFCDWKQDWMEHADGWTGRRLWSIFNSSMLFDGAVRARVFTNLSFSPECYGYARAQDMKSLIPLGLASDADVQSFLADQAALDAKDRYFYSITGYAYVARLRKSS
jgi:SAM-dependent methyltransferase